MSSLKYIIGALVVIWFFSFIRGQYIQAKKDEYKQSKKYDK